MAIQTSSRPDVAGHLPLRPVEFLVLAVLVESDLHGYGIVQQIVERTAGRVRVAPGNLYRVLDRMMDRGLLSEADRRPAGNTGDERRRYYRITDLGRGVVAAEADLLGSIADRVRQSLPAQASKPA